MLLTAGERCFGVEQGEDCGVTRATSGERPDGTGDTREASSEAFRAASGVSKGSKESLFSWSMFAVLSFIQARLVNNQRANKNLRNES